MANPVSGARFLVRANDSLGARLRGRRSRPVPQLGPADAGRRLLELAVTREDPPQAPAQPAHSLGASRFEPHDLAAAPPFAPYVLVTAARNERDYVRHTLDSVVAQTIKPHMWVIVSDGSTDGTDDLVRRYAAHHSFVHLCRRDGGTDRNTAAKVRALKMGLEALAQTDYAYIGNLDGDISFGARYFETLLGRFAGDPTLGVIGGRIFEADSRGRPREAKTSLESVAGAVQFFRRECFDQIGGYLPLPGGMEDGIAEISARYHGWRSLSYKDLPVRHHREMGTVGRSVYKARFKSGVTEYTVGFGFGYHLVRALSRVAERPYVISTPLIIAGYVWARLSGKPRVVPEALIGFIRREQTRRLVSRLRRRQVAA